MKLKKTLLILLLPVLAACSRKEEVDLEDLGKAEGLSEILAKTTSKPWRGEAFVPGKRGGTWNDAVNADPKSFNMLVAEQDSATSDVMNRMHEYLAEYDVVRREWKGLIAFPEVIVDEAAGTLRVLYTLREDLYWTYYGSNQKIKVTSDDVVFWYNDIRGDPACQSSGYYQQFLTMPDGSEAHVNIEKIDERRFAFHYPRIVADPILATNMEFGPRHLYEPAKREGGAAKIRDIFSVNTDPKTIPSIGKWFLVEYTPGQRLVYKRNPDYWRKDDKGLSIPYMEEMVVRIIPEENTQLLLFKEGQAESYSLRPEDLDDLVKGQGAGNSSYTIFNNEGNLSAAYWTFNQNPVNKDKPQYEWFTQKEFRQAMSSLLNRDRIISQVYRGLAEPKLGFFPEPNPYYNPAIISKYTYNQKEAERLLSSIGFKRDGQGVMRDGQGRAVEFDLSIRSESTVNNDTASIIMNELSAVGIKVNIRVLDFQKLVELLFTSFEWDSMIMGLSGSNIFPSQGSNVWPSSGNLHLWYPNQKSPATEWEERVDYLYNEGCYTIDREKAKAIWDEYQQIILEQCPVISLLRPRGFYALQNRWDFTNLYYDNANNLEAQFIFLK